MNKIKSIVICFLMSLIAVFFVPFAVPRINNVSADNAQIQSKQTEKIDISEAEEQNMSTFAGKKIASCEYAYNYDGSADYIYVQFEGGGYAVLSKHTMELMEYSLQGELPYSNSAKKYYGGPANYLEKTDCGFVNIATNEKITIADSELKEVSENIRDVTVNDRYRVSELETNSGNIIESIDNYLQIDNNINSIASDDSPVFDKDHLIPASQYIGKMIPNYRYFEINPTFGENKGGRTYGRNNTGTCGPIAAQILLGYNNYYNDRRIIENKYLNGYDDTTDTVKDKEKNPNYCTDPMSMTSETLGTRSEAGGTDNSFYTKVITTIMEPKQTGSTIQEVHDGIKSILDEHLSPEDYTINFKSTKWLFGCSIVDKTPIINEIDAGRPLIISMDKSLGGVNHQVVGYGYQDYQYQTDDNTTYSGYIVHLGWDDEWANCAWINSSWCKGYISLAMNHTHGYNVFESVVAPGREVYKCRKCGHRTDAAIDFKEYSRYEERRVTLPQNGYKYKDYTVHINKKGNYLFQTFGPKDVKLFLYDSNENLLASDDAKGYKLNSLISYNVTACDTFKLRVCFYSHLESGDIKISVLFGGSGITKYEDIGSIKPGAAIESSTLNDSIMLKRCTVDTEGTYTFYTERALHSDGYTDMTMYLIDPSSTGKRLFDDNSGGNQQPKITTTLKPGIEYLLAVAPAYVGYMQIKGPYKLCFNAV